MERPDYPTQEHLNNWFVYHEATVDQVIQYQAIRQKAKDLATTILANCPLSADRTDAIRKVREAVMIANASIACGGK